MDEISFANKNEKFKSFGNKQKCLIKNCSRIEERAVIKFLVAEGCKAVEIHRRMSAVYASPTHQSFSSWEAL